MMAREVFAGILGRREVFGAEVDQAQIRRAWLEAVNRNTTVLFANNVPNARYRSDGSWDTSPDVAGLYALSLYLTPRGMRDAFIFNSLVVGSTPSGGDSEVDRAGEATKEQIGEVVGAIGTTVAVIGQALAYITTALTALGLNASLVASIAGASAGLLASLGPFIAAVGIIAAIVAAFVGFLGIAQGHELTHYILKGIPFTEDIRAAVRLRDEGGRLSDAMSLIQGRDVTLPPDNYEIVYNAGKGRSGYFPTYRQEELDGKTPIDDQRALENMVSTYLLTYDDLPCLTQGCGTVAGHDTLWWIGGKESPYPLPMKGRRLILAQLAGLGSAESEWLAELPTARKGEKPVAPQTPSGGATTIKKGTIPHHLRKKDSGGGGVLLVGAAAVAAILLFKGR